MTRQIPFATVVSTRVLTPRVAVLWAAFFNFVAAFVFGVNVPLPSGRGTIDPTIVTAWLPPCCSHWSDLLGHYHMVVWTTDEFLARPSGGPHRCRRCKGRMGRSPDSWGQQDSIFIVLSPVLGFFLAIGLSPADSPSCHALFSLHL